MLFDGISRYFGTIFRLLLLCYFFMWDFARVFLRFFQLWTGAKLYGCRNKMFKAKMFQIDWTGKREPQKGWSGRQDLMQPDEGQERDSIPWIRWRFGKRFYLNTPSPWLGKLYVVFSVFTSSPLIVKWKNYLIGHYFKFSKKNKKQIVVMVQLLCPYLIWTSYSAGENPS